MYVYLFHHEVNGSSDVVRAVFLLQQRLAVVSLDAQLKQRFHRLREPTLGEAEPEVVEVLVEHLEVAEHHSRVEGTVVGAAEHRVEDGVEHGFSRELPQPVRGPRAVVRVSRQRSRCFQFVVRVVQVVGEVPEAFTEELAPDRASRVLDHLACVLQDEAEHVPVDLLLDRVEIKALLSAHRLEAVRVVDDGQVLVHQADSEDVAVALVRFLEEIHRVQVEVFARTPDQVALHDRGLSRSSESRKYRKIVQEIDRQNVLPENSVYI